MGDSAAFIDGTGSDPQQFMDHWGQSARARTPGVLQICAFGSPQVRLAGDTLSFVRRKSVALLIYLASTRRPHTRDALANLLWGDLPQERAAANLRKVLVELRERIDDVVIITRQTVALNPDFPVWLDVEAFEAAVNGGIAATDPHALEKAAERYHDDFLAGFFLADADDFDEWVLLYREHLRSRLIEALQTLAQIRMESREDRAAIAAMSRLIALDPWREEAYRKLMLLLARNGERSAAIAQYEACRRVLTAELGVEPLEETTAIYHRLRIDPAIPPHTLPSVCDYFVGRDRELRYIVTRLANPVCRMLTLVGLPGVGKTQLALHAAHAFLERDVLIEQAFSDGIFYAPLTAPAAGVDPPMHLFVAIAAAIGVPVPTSSTLRHLEAALREKSMLLILDDLDAVGAPEALSQFLARCPGVKVLVTASAWIHIPEEWTMEISGLALPETPADIERSSAGALLLHHTQRHGASEELTGGDREAIERICRAVDGNPLALILAAQWRRTMSYATIADGLARGFDLLEAIGPSFSGRHWSMRESLAQVVERMPQVDRSLLQRLAIFAGGFDRNAARAVADAPPLRLLALSGYSVLTCAREGRYTVPALVRRYLAAHPIAPDEVAQVSAFHAAYYAKIVASCARASAAEPHVWRAIEAEHENVRAAWDWAVRRGEIATLMAMYEGIRAWSVQTGRADAWAGAFDGAVRMARSMVRDHEIATRALGWLLVGYGDTQMQQRHFAAAIAAFEEAHARARATGAIALEARCLLSWGEALHALGDIAAAEVRERAALALAEAAGADLLEAESLMQLGLVALTGNDPNGAAAFFERAITCYRDLQEPFMRSLLGIEAPAGYEKDALLFLCA